MVGATKHCRLGIIYPKKTQVQKTCLVLQGYVANVSESLKHRVWEGESHLCVHCLLQPTIYRVSK